MEEHAGTWAIRWCSSPSKYTWLRLVLFLLFILANVALYSQSKHAILDAILPQFGFNLSFIFIASTNDNSTSYSILSNYDIPNGSTDASSVIDIMMSAYLVRKTKLKKPFMLEKVVNPHDFPRMISPNVNCSDQGIELVICVAVSHDNHKGRTVIRQTWGSYAYNISNKALLVFFIGSKLQSSDLSNTTDQHSHILEESSKYGDILQEDFIDTYNNLSIKSVSILKWVSIFCSNAKFILKADDDMYVNIPFLITVLHEYASVKSNINEFLVGAVQENAHPVRDPSSKWYTTFAKFPENTYPKYLSGTAYAMTSNAALLLYEASLRLPSFWLEDIYTTGICAEKASVSIFNSGYFSLGKPAVSGCSFRRHVSGHRYSHQEMLQIHKELYDPNLKCEIHSR